MGIVLDWNIIVGFGAGLLILYIILRVLSAPVKWILRLILNVFTGVLGLLAVNLVGGFFGFEIAINIVTAFIVGFFGVPGIFLLVLLKIFVGF